MLSSWVSKTIVYLVCSTWTLATCEERSTGPFPPLLDATLDDLSQGLESGLFTSVDLVNAYVARIRETKETLNAVTEVNPDAVFIAASLDLIRQQGGPLLGPLHGIPVLIKDNIATADNMNNTAGSYALVGARVPEDSTVAAKLRRAGAIILGKAHMSQWADYRSTNSSAGWSTYGGQTRGAYYPDQDPSGSSSGSGVASSVGLAWASLGTETFGSITLPCDVNNLAGIKPTVGLTSRYLVVPISEHQDTVGPMARTVKDAAHLLAAIVGPDSNDNYTTVLGADALVNLPEYFSKLAFNPYNITSVSELQNWTQNDPREEWPEKNTEIWEKTLSDGIQNTDPVFWEYYSRNQYLAGPQSYAGALRNYSLDAIVLPTQFVLVTAAVLGTPVVTVPFGRHPDNTTIVKNGVGNLNLVAPNLPFGIGFAGAPFSEETLISIAYAFEQKTQARTRIRPYIQPKTELGDVVGRRVERGPLADL
ncbi:glutamyl-tRNA amidotransferase subunit A [Colletotrichum tofieldiae]|nr:glutamyl-tRNA amidotransferase subunit A [Colletotrichum tofieldiae]